MQVAAAKAALEVLAAAPSLPAQLQARAERYRRKLHGLGFDTLASQTPVVPIICRSTEQAHDMARMCQREGLFVQPIVYPTVPKALPRLRTIVNLSHSDDDLDYAVGVLEKAGAVSASSPRIRRSDRSHRTPLKRWRSTMSEIDTQGLLQRGAEGDRLYPQPQHRRDRLRRRGARPRRRTSASSSSRWASVR